ncbi:MAG: ATP-binding protein [Bacteroidetes bacterium]|nr:ATP-binding protein [Bacteroidota bacterium]
MIGILLIDEIENHLHPKWQKIYSRQVKKSTTQSSNYCHFSFTNNRLGTADLDYALILELEYEKSIVSSLKIKLLMQAFIKGFSGSDINFITFLLTNSKKRNYWR